MRLLGSVLRHRLMHSEVQCGLHNSSVTQRNKIMYRDLIYMQYLLVDKFIVALAPLITFVGDKKTTECYP